MEAKKYSQFGTFSVILLLPFLSFSTGLLIKSGFSNNPLTIIALFLILIFLMALLFFY